MKKLKIIIILLNLVIVLVLFHISISKKEAILSKGKLVLLELAPVDPRSLMQGDYMDLRYAISQGDDVSYEDIPRRGYCVVRLDSGIVAKRVRLQPGKKPLNVNEYLIEYTAETWQLNIGAQSFFFQEGQAVRYDKAKYGALKIDEEGNSVLVGLYDANKRSIQ